MRRKRAEVAGDWPIVAKAEGQHLVLSARELTAIGLDESAVRRRVQAGRLHRVHRGVYALVPPRHLTVRGRWMAAVLACGDGASLSHRSAVGLWEMGGAPALIEVSTPGNRRGPRGVLVHAERPGIRVTVHDGIAVTTPAQTLVDLAGTTAGDRTLERAIHVAERERLLTPEDFDFLVANHRGCPGAGRLRRLLASPAPAAVTESELEEAFIAALDAHGVPRPQTQVPWTLPDGTAIRIDALWRRERVAAELDGRDHLDPRRIAADNHRDAQLLLAGLWPVRFTHAQVTRDPRGVAATVRDLLVRRADPPQ